MSSKPAWHRLQPLELGLGSTDFFPESWTSHTRIRRLGIQVETQRPVRMILLRQTDGNTPEQLMEYDCPAGCTVVTLPPLTGINNRLFCRFMVEGREMWAEQPWLDAAWVCDRPPERRPQIAVIICTRDRQRQLQTLLDECRTQIDAVEFCIVINQGNARIESHLNPADFGGKLLIVEQDNQGGAGGFTRGIMEAMDLPSITHVLLMDDDVQIGPGLFQRIRAALSYLPSRICVGGTMVDIEHRNRVVSLGHGFDPEHAMTTDRVRREGSSLNDLDTRAHLDQASEVAFCGWWCFCFPLTAVTACGLPLPLFLRGDDAEYGLRLGRGGFKTVMWPGISVAHPLIRNRTRPWHQFYDRRNALICTCLQIGRIPPRAIFRLVRGIVNALVLYRYAEARAHILAIEAYLDGANGLASWNEERHTRLVADDEQPCTAPLGPRTTLDLHKSPLMRTAVTLTHLIGDVLRPASPAATAAIAIDISSWKTGVRHRPLAVLAIENNLAERLMCDPRQARSALTHLLRAVGRLTIVQTPCASAMIRLGTVEWWQKRLKKPNHLQS